MSTCPCGGTIVPIDDDWAGCDKCGDNTFPISNKAAYGADEPVELVGTLNGEPMTGVAFGETALLLRAQAAERERDQLREALASLTTAFHGAWVDAGYRPEDLGDEYNEAMTALSSTPQPGKAQHAGSDGSCVTPAPVEFNCKRCGVLTCSCFDSPEDSQVCCECWDIETNPEDRAAAPEVTS